MSEIRRDNRFLAAAFLALAALPAGFTRAADSPPRIVSLSPHITELLFAAGAGARVVGVDDSSDFPPEAAGIPRLGEAASLDVEGLVRLRPSLIIAWETGTPPRLLAELHRLKLPVLVTEQRRLDDIGEALLEFGRLAGTQAAAADAAASYREALAQLRSRYAGRRTLRVFYQVWDRPLYTLSGAHVVSEAISLCGGENVFAGLAAPAPAIDREAVLERDPDVILIGALGREGERQTADWNRFPSLRAVRGHHIFTIDPSLASRMAPRILEGVAAICGALEEARDVPGVSIKRQSRNDNARH